jgi:hypothetical protein
MQISTVKNVWQPFSSNCMKLQEDIHAVWRMKQRRQKQTLWHWNGPICQFCFPIWNVNKHEIQKRSNERISQRSVTLDNKTYRSCNSGHQWWNWTLSWASSSAAVGAAQCENQEWFGCAPIHSVRLSTSPLLPEEQMLHQPEPKANHILRTII